MPKTIYENIAPGGGSFRATLNKRTGVVSLQHASARSNYNYITRMKVKAEEFYEVAEKLDIWNPYNRQPSHLNRIAVIIKGEHIY